VIFFVIVIGLGIGVELFLLAGILLYQALSEITSWQFPAISVVLVIAVYWGLTYLLLPLILVLSLLLLFDFKRHKVLVQSTIRRTEVI